MQKNSLAVPFIFGNIKPFRNYARSSIQRFFCRSFSKDGAAVGFACMRIMCILLFEPICSLYEIPAGVLRGTWYAVLPALSTVLGTCVFRIVWIFTVFNTHKSLEKLYLRFPFLGC